MTNLSPQDAETVREADLPISDRLDQIELMLKFVPLPWYRQQLIREYLELTTDPEERHEHR